MRIVYDGHIYEAQAAGGINRYFENIVPRLPPDMEPTLLATKTQAVNFPQVPRLETIRPLFLPPGRVGRLMRRWYFQAVLARREFDLAHPTYYNLLTVQSLSAYRCPVVLTVWDMVHEIRPQEMDSNGYVARVKRNAVLAADAILCISHSTKRDLLEHFPQVADRVTVTPLAASITESLCPGEMNTPERPYYLYVGSRIGYKNFAFLLKALARVVARHPERMLCVVGGAWTQAEQQTLRDLNLTERHVRLLGQVEDAELACLYRDALALVYPSLYEGFGIPPLEAMSCGTPVVACNTSSLPEVVGDAALLFEPGALDDLVSMMLSVTEEPGRSTLIAKGRERAALFSWERTAFQTVEVYRRLVASK